MPSLFAPPESGSAGRLLVAFNMLPLSTHSPLFIPNYSTPHHHVEGGRGVGGHGAAALAGRARICRRAAIDVLACWCRTAAPGVRVPRSAARTFNTYIDESHRHAPDQITNQLNQRYSSLGAALTEAAQNAVRTSPSARLIESR